MRWRKDTQPQSTRLMWLYLPIGAGAMQLQGELEGPRVHAVICSQLLTGIIANSPVRLRLCCRRRRL